MKPWYLESKTELPKKLGNLVDELVKRDAPRLEAYMRYGQLYGGRRRIAALERMRRVGGLELPAPELTTTNVGAHTEEQAPGHNAPLRLNVVKAAVDTVVSKVGKLRPRPTFLTTGGNWTLQQRAKKLQRFCDGAYHQCDAYRHGMDVFRDAMVYGTGVLMPYGSGAAVKRPRIDADRPPPWEFFVDEDDAEYGDPSCLYRVRMVSRERVRQVFGEDALPTRASGDDAAVFYTSDDVTTTNGDYLRVVEAWYRPRDPSGDPVDGPVRTNRVMAEGRHVIAVEQKLVEDGYHPFPAFPPVFFHWSKPPTGFWGDSAVAEVEGVQVEINALLQVARESMRLVGMPMVFAHEDSNLTPQLLTNRPGQHYTWTGQTPPTVHTFQALAPQHLTHLWNLYAKAFEILGSNQLAASATAPPGLESGRALERLSEEHSERFMQVSREFNYVFGELLARRFLLIAKELDSTTEGGFGLRTPVKRESERIKWSEVEVDSDAFLIQVFDTSVLPTLPSARIQEVERLQVATQIDLDEARRLLDFPDLAESNSFATADYDNLLWQFEAMLERGEDVEPEPYQNLDRIIKLGPAAVLRAQRDGAPARNIDKLRSFVDMAIAMRQMTQDAAAAAVEPGGAGGAGERPPDRRDDTMSTAVPPDTLPVA